MNLKVSDKKRIFSFLYLAGFLAASFIFIVFLAEQNILDYGIPQQSQFFHKIPKALEIISDFTSFRSKLMVLDKWAEVDLPAMKIRIYEKESLVEEYNILKRGNPLRWGGTSSGLNKVNYKAEKWFSNTALVFMPNAINFYGKYYIHGEPFYPSGKMLISENSGGCIQVKVDQAKIVYDFVEKDTPVLVVDKENDSFVYPRKKTSPLPAISSKNYLIGDLDSGTVLTQKGSQEKKSIFSLTGLMTALAVSENTNLDSEIEVSPRILNPETLVPNFEIGKRFMLGELFYPIFMESSFEASRILTAYLGRTNTLNRMNEKALTMMMPETHFADTIGKDPENTSTARDLFYLARYLTNNEPLAWKMTRGETVFSFTKSKFENLSNENIFYAQANFIGGKASQGNGIFLFKVFSPATSQRRIAIVVLESEDLKNDTEKILEWVKANYF